jgi:hypothetical protein
MTNLNDIKKPSRFLSQVDVEPPLLLTIAGCKRDNVAPANARSEEKVVLAFKEHEKPLVLNVTNYKIIKKITGKDEIEDWVGTQVVVYFNPDIEYQGEIIGGIRVRAPKKAGTPVVEEEF